MAHGFFQCICGQPIDLTRIHLFCYVHGGGHVVTRDAFWESFASIVKDAKFHVSHKQTHVFLTPSFHSLIVVAKSNH
jgi:hypothetical protein